MTIFVNLDALPSGQHLFTLWLEWACDCGKCVGDEHLTVEEVDVVASARATREQVIAAADEIENSHPWASGKGLAGAFTPGFTITQVCDQSNGASL